MMIRILVLTGVLWMHAYVLGSQHMHDIPDVPVDLTGVMVEVDPESVQGDDQQMQQRHDQQDPVSDVLSNVGSDSSVSCTDGVTCRGCMSCFCDGLSQCYKGVLNFCGLCFEDVD